MISQSGGSWSTLPSCQGCKHWNKEKKQCDYGFLIGKDMPLETLNHNNESEKFLQKIKQEQNGYLFETVPDIEIIPEQLTISQREFASFSWRESLNRQLEHLVFVDERKFTVKALRCKGQFGRGLKQ